MNDGFCCHLLSLGGGSSGPTPELLTLRRQIVHTVRKHNLVKKKNFASLSERSVIHLHVIFFRWTTSQLKSSHSQNSTGGCLLVVHVGELRLRLGRLVRDAFVLLEKR